MKAKKYTLLVVPLFFLSMLAGCGFFDNALDTESNTQTVEEAVESVEVKAENEKKEATPKSQTDETEADETDSSKEESDEKDEASESEEEIAEKPAIKEPAVQPASGTFYVTTPSLNVRAGDSTAYEALGFITLNTGINVTGITANGWYEFSYNGNKGYVSGNYLSKEKHVVEAAAAVSTPAEKKTSAKKTSTPNNVVDTMTTLGNSQQVILVTTKGSSTTTGQFQTFEKNGSGKWNQVIQGTSYVGKTGMSANKTEGDGKSPIGKFTLGTAFGYQGNPGTKLNFKHSTSDDVWVDDSHSKNYNTWQKDSHSDKDWNSAESMMQRLYNYGIVINYNTGQNPGRGSAIFMHVGNSYTLGCTAMTQSNLISIMKWLDPAKNPVIIQTPESGLNQF